MAERGHKWEDVNPADRDVITAHLEDLARCYTDDPSDCPTRAAAYRSAATALADLAPKRAAVATCEPPPLRTMVAGGVATTETREDRIAEEIEHALNRHSRENESGTPDFILSEFLMGCLGVYEKAIKRREDWHGRPVNTRAKANPASPPAAPPASNGNAAADACANCQHARDAHEIEHLGECLGDEGPGTGCGCDSFVEPPAAPPARQGEPPWAICPRCKDRVAVKDDGGRIVFVGHAAKGTSPRMHCRESGQPAQPPPPVNGSAVPDGFKLAPGWVAPPKTDGWSCTHRAHDGEEAGPGNRAVAERTIGMEGACPRHAVEMGALVQLCNCSLQYGKHRPLCPFAERPADRSMANDCESLRPPTERHTEEVVEDCPKCRPPAPPPKCDRCENGSGYVRYVGRDNEEVAEDCPKCRPPAPPPAEPCHACGRDHRNEAPADNWWTGEDCVHGPFCSACLPKTKAGYHWSNGVVFSDAPPQAEPAKGALSESIRQGRLHFDLMTAVSMETREAWKRWVDHQADKVADLEARLAAAEKERDNNAEWARIAEADRDRANEDAIAAKDVCDALRAQLEEWRQDNEKLREERTAIRAQLAEVTRQRPVRASAARHEQVPDAVSREPAVK